ncbi:MAG TPA: hypothetical protein GX699_07675 [Firmicutes bacterium]|nr:hypothetical protein [Bacillota bacterium]
MRNICRCRLLLLACLGAVLLATALGAWFNRPGSAQEPPRAAPPADRVPLPPADGPGTEPGTDPGTEPGMPRPGYDYSRPVPEAEGELPEGYFTDAVFIGDSRTRGLELFGELEAVFYAATGLNVRTASSKAVIAQGEKKVTVLEALRRRPFGKVYIMLGINELGWAYPEIFIEKYAELVQAIREINPGVLLYVQSLLPVTAERDDKDDIYNNDKIRLYNELLRELAAKEKFYFLDVAACFTDEEGNLPAGAATDGIHLKAEYCRRWAEYLRKHFIVAEEGAT